MLSALSVLEEQWVAFFWTFTRHQIHNINQHFLHSSHRWKQPMKDSDSVACNRRGLRQESDVYQRRSSQQLRGGGRLKTRNRKISWSVFTHCFCSDWDAQTMQPMHLSLGSFAITRWRSRSGERRAWANCSFKPRRVSEIIHISPGSFMQTTYIWAHVQNVRSITSTPSLLSNDYKLDPLL